MLARTVLLAALFTTTPVGAQSLPSWAEPGRTSEPVSSAFTPGGPGGTPGTPGPPPPQVPADGGLALLALAGVGYGAHRLRRR
jgi:hypothetical protein